MPYSAKIVDKFSDEVEVIEIGFREGFGLSKTIVLVTEEAEPLIQLACYTKSDDYHFRCTAIIWEDNVVIGTGHRVFILDLTNREGRYIDLDSYFIDFHIAQEMLLVTSGMHLCAISNSGQLRWSAKHLGIDGVVIDEMRDSKVFGRGELDPPNGWKPFILDLDTGVLQ